MADAPAAPAAEAPPATPAPEATPEVPETDDAEKWKALSRKNERELKKVQAELETARQSSMTDTEKAVAEAKAAARAEAIAEVQRDRIRDKVEIAAAGKLADPGDAAALLGDLDRFLVGGEIDVKAIAKDIDDLLRAKPYLSPQPGNGAGEGGPRGTTPLALNGDPLEQALKEKLGIK